MTLEDQRLEAAQLEFESYDCGGVIAESSGWESSTQSDTWTRPVFVTNLEDPEGDTLRGDFSVVFETDSAEIVSAYASIDGNDFGQRASPLPTPR